VDGLASGMNWKSYVDAIVTAEQTGETLLKDKQTTLQDQYTAWGAIKTALSSLQDSLSDLKTSTFFGARSATTSDDTIVTASGDSGAATGTYTFKINQLATAAIYNGASDVGGSLSASNDVSGLTLASASFATKVKAGTFTVNNAQISIETTDTLQDVFDKIAAATNNEVAASYDSSTDKITLVSGNNISLGSSHDTSNFLTSAKLANNGSGTVTSSSALGGIPLGATLSSTNLTTAITAGGDGTGNFTINGVSITYDLSKDSLQNVMDRVNNSDAGVTMSYDSKNDRFVLTNNTTGDIGVSLADGTGNFLQATGLTTGALVNGKNLLYTINGGDELSSTSNTITEDSSGITGLKVTALKENDSATVTVASDTEKVKTSIQAFVDAYNNAQKQIRTYTIISTDSKGNVSSGTLSRDREATSLEGTLRSQIFGQMEGLSDTVKQLADLGYQTKSSDNTITLASSSTLSTALSDNIDDIKKFFSDSTSGLAMKFTSYLKTYTQDDGSLDKHQKNLSSSSAAITVQINNMEKRIQADKTRMTNEFQAMEQAQSRNNYNLSYIQKMFA
jgi:flagellar hook-associated protein 2